MELGRRRSSRAFFIAAALVATGCLAIIAGSVYGRTRSVFVSALKWTQRMGLPSWVAPIAQRWASHYGVPVSWVLATIKIESNGNPKLTGDGGRSIGLMQVNSVAHAQRLARHGMTRESLFTPDHNVRIGTEILRESLDDVRKALAGRTPPAPIDQLVALTYWGPRPTLPTLARGGDPRIHNPRRITRWNNALAQA